MDGLSFPTFLFPEISISNVQTNVQSASLQPYRLTIEEAGRSQQFEFLPQRDSIAILLYHRKKRRFLVKKQFRPAVFASRVLQLPHNRGKAVEEIDWNKEIKALGCTLELCSGYVEDRTKHLDDTALALIGEEFGLRVERRYLQHFQTFLTGVRDSGAACHIYYAEIDNAAIIHGQGLLLGCSSQEWLKVGHARAMLRKERSSLMTAAHFQALNYWFLFKEEWLGKATMEETPGFGVERRSAARDEHWFEVAKKTGLLEGEWRFEKSEERGRHPVMRMDYVMMGINQTRAIVIRPDTVSILIKDVDSMKLVMMRRFRPAALVGRVMARPENLDTQLEQIDFSAYPDIWKYTYELASGSRNDGEKVEDAVLRVASSKLGYDVPVQELKLVTKLIVGSSEGGETKYVYYAECRKPNRLKNWRRAIRAGDERVLLLRYAGCHLRPSSSPPSVYVALDWMSKHERRQSQSMTRRQLNALDALIKRQKAEFKREMERIELEIDQTQAAAAVKELEERKERGGVEEEGEEVATDEIEEEEVKTEETGVRMEVVQENVENEPVMAKPWCKFM